MAGERQIVNSVQDFIDSASEAYGRMMRQRFADDMICSVLEVGMESPIEDLFWIACHMLVEAAFERVNPLNGIERAHGVHIVPQARIGNYRVDFQIFQIGLAPKDVYTPIVVELDGHDFHDKDKRQRSYEKARDRYLVKAGFKVLHFTGSDVFGDPYKVAYETLQMLGVFRGFRETYDPKDPLGLGPT